MKTYSAFNWMLYSRGLMVMPPEGVEGKEEEGISFFLLATYLCRSTSNNMRMDVCCCCCPAEKLTSFVFFSLSMYSTDGVWGRCCYR